MIQFTLINPINAAEFAHLDARMLADIGIESPGQDVHPSQLRRLPSKPNAFAQLVTTLLTVMGSARLSARAAG